jgi:hypothetical protein
MSGFARDPLCPSRGRPFYSRATAGFLLVQSGLNYKTRTDFNFPANFSNVAIPSASLR